MIFTCIRHIFVEIKKNKIYTRWRTCQLSLPKVESALLLFLANARIWFQSVVLKQRAGYHQGRNKIAFPCKWPQIMLFLVFARIDKSFQIGLGSLLISQKELMSVWVLPRMRARILQGTLNFLKISLEYHSNSQDHTLS